jgi:hypothetical protein
MKLNYDKNRRKTGLCQAYFHMPEENHIQLSVFCDNLRSAKLAVWQAQTGNLPNCKFGTPEIIALALK